MTNALSTPPTLTCPICGSADVQSSTSMGQLSLPFSPVVHYESTSNKCRNCGSEGDFLKANDDRIASAKEQASRASVVHMLELLGAGGITQAYFERALDLPARTLARWKTGECSASGATLLRVVCTYPWLLEVGDANYDPTFATTKLVFEGAKTFATHLGLLRQGHPQSFAVMSIHVEMAVPSLTGPPLSSARSVLQERSPLLQQLALVPGASPA